MIYSQKFNNTPLKINQFPEQEILEAGIECVNIKLDLICPEDFALLTVRIEKRTKFEMKIWYKSLIYKKGLCEI